MSKNRSQRNAIILGVSVLICVAIFLLASPSMLFSSTVTFIDSDLYASSNDAVSVRTKTDFGDQLVMSKFPQEIGRWQGYDYNTSEIIEALGADVLLIRSYEPSTLTQPVFLTIVQAKTESSFHPPEICFPSQGFKIQETGEEIVTINEASWVKGTQKASVPFKKLVVTKSTKEGEIFDRRIVLFCYIKGNQFYSDTVTMIEVEAVVTTTGDYSDSLKEQKEFISTALPVMFEPVSEDRWRPIISVLFDWGVGGYLILAILFLIPLAIILYPTIQSKGHTK